MKDNSPWLVLPHKKEENLNITMNRAELLSAAQRATAIASENAPLEALKGALLETDAAAGTLTLTATNLEVSLKQTLACQTTENDALVVNAKLLAGMLEQFPGETVTLRRTPGVASITLESGNTVYNVIALERGNFPELQMPFPEDAVKITGIPSMARRTTFATTEDKDKPLLKCVNLMFTQEGLKAAGYDGSSLVTAKGDEKSTGNASFLLPASSLEKLSALCTDEDEFEVGVTGVSIVFTRPGLVFSARLMEGDFADTGRIMNNVRNQFTVLSDVAELRRALKSVSAVAPKGRVKLAFDGGRITFSCKGELGSAVETVDTAPLTGSPQGVYWYAVPALLNCLKALSGTVTLGIAQAGMLDLSTEHAYYMQVAMREPVATPVAGVKPKTEPKPRKKAAAKAKQPKKTAVKKAA